MLVGCRVQSCKHTWCYSVKLRASWLRAASSGVDVDDVEVQFRAAIERQPLQASGHLAIGKQLAEKRRFRDARACFQRAAELEPSRASTMYYLGRMHAAVGDVVEAERSYHASIALQPANAESNYALGTLLYSRGNLVDAEHSFQRATEACTEGSDVSMMARYNLSVICGLSGRFGEAAEHLEYVIRGKPKLIHAIYWPRMNEHRERVAQEAAAVPSLLSSAVSYNHNSMWAQVAMGVPSALADARALGYAPTWLAVRQIESYRVMGADAQGGALGVSFLDDGPEAIFSHASTKQASGVGESIVIIGSGLGCLCHFAAARLQKPCVGYDILIKSCIVEAQKISARHNVPDTCVTFCGQDGRSADVRQAAICWINDYAFPERLRTDLLTKFAAELPSDALLVTYWPKPDGDGMEALRLLYTLPAEVSWKRHQDHFVYAVER